MSSWVTGGDGWLIGSMSLEERKGVTSTICEDEPDEANHEELVDFFVDDLLPFRGKRSFLLSHRLNFRINIQLVGYNFQKNFWHIDC